MLRPVAAVAGRPAMLLPVVVAEAAVVTPAVAEAAVAGEATSSLDSIVRTL
jgi:hypothetical protein